MAGHHEQPAVAPSASSVRGGAATSPRDAAANAAASAVEQRGGIEQRGDVLRPEDEHVIGDRHPSAIVKALAAPAEHRGRCMPEPAPLPRRRRARRPAVRSRRSAAAGREGFTSDDVLDELTLLGRVVVDVRDAPTPARCRRSPAGWSCATPARSFGEGRSLTAAALRCLIEAEDDLAAEVARGLDALGDLLDDEDD